MARTVEQRRKDNARRQAEWRTRRKEELEKLRKQVKKQKEKKISR